MDGSGSARVNSTPIETRLISLLVLITAAVVAGLALTSPSPLGLIIVGTLFILINVGVAVYASGPSRSPRRAIALSQPASLALISTFIYMSGTDGAGWLMGIPHLLVMLSLSHRRLSLVLSLLTAATIVASTALWSDMDNVIVSTGVCLSLLPLPWFVTQSLEEQHHRRHSESERLTNIMTALNSQTHNSRSDKAGAAGH